MDFDIYQFREDFPEFADTTKYPDLMIEFWSGVGGTLLNAVRWATTRDYGLKLFTAHQCSMARMNMDNAAIGAVPGQGNGVVSSNSVGGVSVSFDTNLSGIRDAGQYNATSYGVQFYQLSQLIGMGGFQE